MVTQSSCYGVTHQQCTKVNSGHARAEPQRKTHCSIDAFSVFIKLIRVVLSYIKGELKKEETKEREGQNRGKQWF